MDIIVKNSKLESQKSLSRNYTHILSPCTEVRKNSISSPMKLLTKIFNKKVKYWKFIHLEIRKEEKV